MKAIYTGPFFFPFFFIKFCFCVANNNQGHDAHEQLPKRIGKSR